MEVTLKTLQNKTMSSSQIDFYLGMVLKYRVYFK